MHQEFKEWHEKKSDIQDKPFRTYFHEREVWWCSIGQNVGREQNGKGKNFARPVIVFRKFSNEVFWGIPLTTQPHAGKYYLPIDLGDRKIRTATLSQLKLIDGKRLYEKLGDISKEQHEEVRKAVITLCMPNENRG